MSDNETLFLLTSTQDPYIRDALDLLFLPSGIEYRFRYRKKWLSEKFQVKNVIKSLKNKHALLIHIESIMESDGKYKIKEFIPIRKAQITGARDYGEILWISFSLGDWVKYDDKTDNNGVNQYHNYIKYLTPEDSKKYVKQILYYTSNLKLDFINDNLNNEKVLSNWFKIVTEIYKLEAHKKINSIFTKFLSIKNITNGKKIIPKRHTHKILYDNIDDEIESSFNLSSDAEYLIEILQYYPQGKIDQPFKFKTLVDGKNVLGLKLEDIVQGRYDLLKFLIKTPTLEKNVFSYIQFNKEGESSEQFTISTPIIIVKILGSMFRVYGSASGIFLGLLLTGIASQLITQDQILKLLLSVVGSIITTLGAYYLRKK